MSSVSATGMINYSLTALGEAGTYLLDKSGHLIAPTVLGQIGGRLAGSDLGLFQGLTSGVYHAVVHVPFQRYISKNTGVGKDKISQKAAHFFKAAGVICGVVIPILITAKWGHKVTNPVMAKLPASGFIRWCLVSEKKREYSVITAMMIEVMPVLAQHTISFWRKEDERNKRY